MELDLEIKQKLTERFLRKINEKLTEDITENIDINDVYYGLLDGKHTIYITRHKKFTIAEVEYFRNNYVYHFFGISARNPYDEEEQTYGIKIAVEEAILKLLTKFYFDEIK
jgi:hypothetical protein